MAAIMSCSSDVRCGAHGAGSGCTHIALHFALAPQHGHVFLDAWVLHLHAQQQGVGGPLVQMRGPNQRFRQGQGQGAFCLNSFQARRKTACGGVEGLLSAAAVAAGVR